MASNDKILSGPVLVGLAVIGVLVLGAQTGVGPVESPGADCREKLGLSRVEAARQVVREPDGPMARCLNK